MLPVYFVYLSTSLIKKKDSATTSLTKIVSLYQSSVIPTNVKANTALVGQSHSYNNVPPFFLLTLSISLILLHEIGARRGRECMVGRQLRHMLVL